MAQQHLDRLSAVDASFLHQEGAATHMHIGAIAQFAADAPPYADLVEHIRGRLHLVPRYRQKLAIPPGRFGRQRWVDDPRFNLEYHVRHTALPRPGDDERLLRLAGRIFSQRLDRSKPLWELWMVEGLEDGHWALISKTHHSLVDGVSGVDLTTMLFDLQPDPQPQEPAGVWVPQPEPSGAELAAASLTSAARRTLGLPLRTVALAAQPSRAVADARETLEGLAEVVRAGMTSAPDTPLNVAISPHRRIAIAPAELDDFKLVKNAFGGTVNDVVLTVVAGALRDWLHSRGMRTEGLEMKACVPVSTRAPEDDGSLGNRITQLIAPLPIHLADPVERLRVVSAAMAGIKQSKQALGAERIAGAQDFAPPTILAQSSRMNFSTRFYNLLVTNIPGPQFPLYVLGRELEGMYPVAFLAGDRALAIAIMSYNGRMNFGLIGDYDAMADIDVVAEGITHALRELVRLAA
jgi:diacylglycerol O-acyltransferase / wax synthase